MKLIICTVAIVASLAALAMQLPPSRDVVSEPTVPNRDDRISDARLHQREISKADYEKSIKYASDLIVLAERLKADLERNDRHVLSVATLKKTEEIEKLAKKVRSSLHH